MTGPLETQILDYILVHIQWDFKQNSVQISAGLYKIFQDSTVLCKCKILDDFEGFLRSLKDSARY